MAELVATVSSMCMRVNSSGGLDAASVSPLSSIHCLALYKYIADAATEHHAAQGRAYRKAFKGAMDTFMRRWPVSVQPPTGDTVVFPLLQVGVLPVLMHT